MTLDEAIQHARQRAIFRDMCGQEHLEVAEWLEELKELRDKYSKLEKITDWMADELADLDCPHYCSVEESPTLEECAVCWKEAARKATEKENGHNS